MSDNVNDNEKKLREALARLERSTRKILDTRGYSRDARSLKMLEEMIREQLTNGHTRNSTRTIR